MNRQEKIFGYINSIHWSDLSSGEFEYLKSGYIFGENVELIIASGINLDTLETFYKPFIDNYHYRNGDLLIPCHTLISVPNDNHKMYLENDINNIINNIILSFRLYKRGLMINNIIFSYSIGAVLKFKAEKAKTDYLVSYDFPLGEPYIIKYEELGDIREIYQNIKDKKISGNIEIAVKKLDSYYSDLSKEKKYIDIITGLEVLHKADETRNHIRDDLIKNITYLYEENNLNTKNIEKNIHEAYNYRNKIIHEGYENNSKKYDRLLNNLTDYLKKSILFILKK